MKCYMYVIYRQFISNRRDEILMQWYFIRFNRVIEVSNNGSESELSVGKLNNGPDTS